MKLNTIQIVFLSSLYYSKSSGVGKFNPTIIKPKIPINIPGLNNLGQVIASNGGTQVVANSAESNGGVEGMPNSVISGSSVIGFGLGKTKTTTRGPNSVEIIGKKDLEEKLANSSKAESDEKIEKPGSGSDLNGTNEKDLEVKSEKENKIEPPVEIENSLTGGALNVTKDADSSNLQSADSGKASSSKSGVTGILGGVGTAVYNVGSTAVGLASSVVDTAVSKVVAPIVSPVVNLVTASGNDQPKIENTKSDSALNDTKDASSLSLKSGDSGEVPGSKSGVASILGGVGTAVYNVGSTAVGLTSSVVDTAVSKVVAPIVSPVVNLVTASENHQPKIENTKSDSALNDTKDASSLSLKSGDNVEAPSSKSGVAGILGGVGSAVYGAGSTAIGLASSVVDTAVSKVVAPIVSPIVSPVINLVTASENDQPKIENTKSDNALNDTKDASSSSLKSGDSVEAPSSKSGVAGILGGVGSAVYGAGSTAVGLASSVVDTAVSKVVAPIVSPIVSPVVNLVTASGNDQPKIENTKSDSTLNGAKDAGSPGLESTDKKESTGSRWGITRFFNSIGSTAIGLVS